MGVAGEDGSAAKRFWIKFQKESLFAMYSPFLVGLASGTLELEAFGRYIAQDVHFLQAFMQAYEIAEECADDDDAKASICQLKKRVSEEIKLYSSFAEAWGVDLVKESAATNASINYTEFLLATAAGKVEGGKVPTKIATPFEKTKIAAYTVSAIAPCMRLHAFLGRELQGVLDHDDNDPPYQKWVENYASESFEALALHTEELLDKLSVSLTGEELEVIERLYQQAIKLETKYFEAQPVPQRSLVPFSMAYDLGKQHFLIFSDFDLTCTVIDSSAVIAEIAILSAAKVEQDESENLNPLKSSEELRKSLDALSRQYSKQDMLVFRQEKGRGFKGALRKLKKACSIRACCGWTAWASPQNAGDELKTGNITLIVI
ncbi:putative aminopyrimidine aminohydrolase [Nymphaea thermarum]|nr:putative aminopyrimidine aminohydrolase [Nymphaea thermarum]